MFLHRLRVTARCDIGLIRPPKGAEPCWLALLSPPTASLPFRDQSYFSPCIKMPQARVDRLSQTSSALRLRAPSFSLDEPRGARGEGGGLVSCKIGPLRHCVPECCEPAIKVTFTPFSFRLSSLPGWCVLINSWFDSSSYNFPNIHKHSYPPHRC